MKITEQFLEDYHQDMNDAFGTRLAYRPYSQINQLFSVVFSIFTTKEFEEFLKKNFPDSVDEYGSVERAYKNAVENWDNVYLMETGADVTILYLKEENYDFVTHTVCAA